VGVIASATGREPVVAGKPELPLHAEAMRRTGAQTPLVVGDRLDTDIEGANRAGVASLLVLSGVTGPVDLLLAGPPVRPTYVARDLRTGLLAPHPAVHRRANGAWTCGGWVCTLADGRLEARGGGDGVAGLRAACAASWAGSGIRDADEAREFVAGLDLDRP
jgi:hypothetical protein